MAFLPYGNVRSHPITPSPSKKEQPSLSRPWLPALATKYEDKVVNKAASHPVPETKIKTGIPFTFRPTFRNFANQWLQAPRPGTPRAT